MHTIYALMQILWAEKNNMYWGYKWFTVLYWRYCLVNTVLSIAYIIRKGIKYNVIGSQPNSEPFLLIEGEKRWLKECLTVRQISKASKKGAKMLNKLKKSINASFFVNVFNMFFSSVALSKWSIVKSTKVCDLIDRNGKNAWSKT